MRLSQRITRLSRALEPEPTGLAERVLQLRDLRAVLFDIYGTLFISASGDIGSAVADHNERAFRAALVAAEIPSEGIGTDVQGAALLTAAIRDFHLERHRAGVEYPEVDIVEIWHRVLSAIPGLSAVDELGEERLRTLALEYECRVNPVWPMPGLGETLDRLRQQGLLLGIVSNAQFYTPLLFEAFLGDTPEGVGFSPPLCAFSYRLLEAKPSKRLFEGVLDVLQTDHDISPRQTLYVGNDMLKDMWPAAEVGCRTAFFAGDRRSQRLRQGDERCAGIRPDLIITDLRQLFEVVAH